MLINGKCENCPGEEIPMMSVAVGHTTQALIDVF